MKYAKPALTISEQAELLLSRGMVGNRALIEARLASVSYYRLSGYWLPFREPDDSFKPGTTFDTVWKRYAFDRRLRLAVLDAIERIEVTVKTLMAYHHSHVHGPFAYIEDAASLPKLDGPRRATFCQHVHDEIGKSKERFVEHFRTKYCSSANLPVWMAAEVMSFGTIMTMFRGASSSVKKNVASNFAMPHQVFDSWLLTLSAVRNICAHHCRLWNRVLGLKPRMPDPSPYPDWHKPVVVGNSHVFAILTICRHCLSLNAPQSGWPDRVRTLLESGAVPLSQMGFPENWRECPIWK